MNLLIGIIGIIGYGELLRRITGLGGMAVLCGSFIAKLRHF